MPAAGQSGAVLILVLWLTLGLAGLALTFGQAAMMDYRATANAVARCEARQAIEGAYRYLGYVLSEISESGELPDLDDYEADSVPVGNATFWLLGRGDEQLDGDIPVFSLVDEASKINLNAASTTREILEGLPGMTPELAAAIMDWRDTDEDPTEDGAESETYLRRDPAYACKNGAFETVEELRLLNGADEELLYGIDRNRNAIIEPWEETDDGSARSFGEDGSELGLLAYLTVYSSEPNVRSDDSGSKRVDINGNGQELRQLLTEQLGQERGEQVAQASGAGRRAFTSVLEFYLRSGMTIAEFETVHADIAVGDDDDFEGLINVNTAPAAVLACIPGIGEEYAEKLVSHRIAQEEGRDSVAWVADVLEEENAIQAGPYLTVRAYQFSADVAAVGQHGRGFCRNVLILDTSGDELVVRYRRDITRLGWPLGSVIREELAQASLDSQRF